MRVVDLGAGSVSRWVSVNKEISTRVGRYELTDRDGDYYEIVKSRFPENIWMIFSLNNQQVELNYDSVNITTLDLINVDKVQKDPKLYFDSFQTAFNQECSRSTRQIRNNEKITLKYEISLTSDGEVLLVESLSENDLVNSNLRRLDTMAKKSLKNLNLNQNISMVYLWQALTNNQYRLAKCLYVNKKKWLNCSLLSHHSQHKIRILNRFINRRGG